MNKLIYRIDKNTDAASLKNALEFYTERVEYQDEVGNDPISLEYYKLMVEYIKDILTAREGEGER